AARAVVIAPAVFMKSRRVSLTEDPVARDYKRKPRRARPRWCAPAAARTMHYLLRLRLDSPVDGSRINFRILRLWKSNMLSIGFEIESKDPLPMRVPFRNVSSMNRRTEA